MSKFCKNCGAMLEDTAFICSNCGVTCNNVENYPPNGGYVQENYPPSGGYVQENYPPSGGYVQENYPPSGGYPYPVTPITPKKKLKWVLPVFLVGIVLFAVSGFVIVYMGMFSNPFSKLDKTMSKKQVAALLDEGEIGGDNGIYCTKNMYGRTGNVYVHVDEYDDRIINNIVWSTKFDSKEALKSYKSKLKSKEDSMNLKPEYIVSDRTLKVVFEFENSYRTAINSFFDCVNNKDSDLFYKVTFLPTGMEFETAEEYEKQAMRENFDEFIKELEDENRQECGDNIKYTYEVRQAEDITGERKENILDKLKDKDYDTADITEMKKVTLNETATGSKGKAVTQEDVYLAKSKGEWYFVFEGDIE